MCVCVCVCVCACVRACVRACVCLWVCSYVRGCVRVCVCTHARELYPYCIFSDSEGIGLLEILHDSIRPSTSLVLCVLLRHFPLRCVLRDVTVMQPVRDKQLTSTLGLSTNCQRFTRVVCLTMSVHVQEQYSACRVLRNLAC